MPVVLEIAYNEGTILHHVTKTETNKIQIKKTYSMGGENVFLLAQIGTAKLLHQDSHSRRRTVLFSLFLSHSQPELLHFKRSSNIHREGKKWHLTSSAGSGKHTTYLNLNPEVTRIVKITCITA